LISFWKKDNSKSLKWLLQKHLNIYEDVRTFSRVAIRYSTGCTILGSNLRTYHFTAKGFLKINYFAGNIR